MYPRSLGIVLRLCLHFGIQQVFIPVGEPWRDGIIEHFNDTYDKKFFRRQWFSSYAMLKQQSKNFQQFHNKNHRYSCLKGKTPLETIEANAFEPLALGPNTRMPKLNFLPDGTISLIRFVRSDRILNIFGEKFEVSKDLVYSYVRAMIVTEIHTLQIYLGEDFVQSFEYRMPTEFNS